MKVSIDLFYIFILVLVSCGKADSTIESTDSDAEVYEATTTSNLVFYQNVDTVYEPAANSPHGDFKLKFNDIAASAFDSSGRLPEGGTFPDGSLVVKEVQSSGTTSLYAVMKKDSKSSVAGNGWLWAEYDTDGKVLSSVNGKGSSCISCHAQSPHRDYTRSFDLH